ncbi:MAG: hypothetical protein ABSF28_27565, partial [Terracidiphilus sp.]
KRSVGLLTLVARVPTIPFTPQAQAGKRGPCASLVSLPFVPKLSSTPDVFPKWGQFHFYSVKNPRYTPVHAPFGAVVYSYHVVTPDRLVRSA